MKSDEALRQTEQAVDELIKALEEGRSETLVKYLEMLSRFHRYSIGNCILISIQRPEATHVAGFQRWKQLGRHVKREEKGISILAPLVRRPKRDDGEADADDEKKRTTVCGFRAVYVFDVSQTEGDPLPQFSSIGGDPGKMVERIEALIVRHGIELEYDLILGGSLGRSEGGRIVIREGLSPAERFAVLAHEFAHELLHRTERRKETTRQIRELEAEAVAFVISRAVGLDSLSRSADYIQLYSGDKELLMQSLDHIQKVASAIIEELTCANEMAAA